MQFHFTKMLNGIGGTVLIFFEDEQAETVEQTLVKMGIENYLFKAGVVWLPLPDSSSFKGFKETFLHTYDQIDF